MIDGSGRHKLIFAAYSLARYVYTVKEAINYVENINNTFVEPLSISELYEQVSRVQKHCEKNWIQKAGQQLIECMEMEPIYFQM